MGQSPSSARRTRNDGYPHPLPSPPPALPPPALPPPAPPSYVLGFYPSASPGAYYPPPPPPPPPPVYQSNSGYSSFLRLLEPLIGGGDGGGRYQYAPAQAPYYVSHHQGGGWWAAPSSAAAYRRQWPTAAPQAAAPPPPYVESQSAKTIKNEVNVHKNTIRIERDEGNPGCHLVSFTFDALSDGSVTIFYFAKEENNCTFLPIYPDIYKSTRVSFKKGIAQKFQQPTGTGIDFGFFETSDLMMPNKDTFPLVIYAEVGPPPPGTDGQSDQSTVAVCVQITLAAIEKNIDDSFLAKIIKQILWVDGERYELKEIFGLESTGDTELGEVSDDMGKECVICLSEQRDTAVFPCRHLCMCSECAKALRLQSNKCPICRQPIEKLMEIKVDRPVQRSTS